MQRNKKTENLNKSPSGVNSKSSKLNKSPSPKALDLNKDDGYVDDDDDELNDEDDYCCSKTDSYIDNESMENEEPIDPRIQVCDPKVHFDKNT